MLVGDQAKYLVMRVQVLAVELQNLIVWNMLRYPHCYVDAQNGW